MDKYVICAIFLLITLKFYVINCLQVCLAAQVFSNTVYAGMNILASLGKLRCQAYMTADFVKKVNDAFDVLNVRSYGKKAASPISANSIQHLKVLSDMKADSESWYVNVKGKKYRPPLSKTLM